MTRRLRKSEVRAGFTDTSRVVVGGSGIMADKSGALLGLSCDLQDEPGATPDKPGMVHGLSCRVPDGSSILPDLSDEAPGFSGMTLESEGHCCYGI